MNRRPVRRYWADARAKVDDEGRCRHCGATGVKLDAAHTMGREYDQPMGRLLALEKGVADPQTLYVDPDAVFPLCHAECHPAYDAGRINMVPQMTNSEQVYAVRVVAGRDPRSRQGIVAAWRRLAGNIAGKEEPHAPDVPDSEHPDIKGRMTLYDILENT